MCTPWRASGKRNACEGKTGAWGQRTTPQKGLRRLAGLIRSPLVRDIARPRMKMSRSKFLVCATLGAALVLAGMIGWRWRHPGLPPGLMKDIRAGIAARGLADPDQRLLKYLEVRYGSMSDPTNRQNAFMDFFNVEHIQALQLLVKHSPEQHRQQNIDAMAKWVASYRGSMTPEERAALSACFQTAEGQAMLRRATAQYNAQDVRYRGNTAPVISQLLRTIQEAQQIPY